MKIEAYSLKTGAARTYVIPSADEALRHSRMTDGVQFDHVERKNLHGGLPMVWPILN